MHNTASKKKKLVIENMLYIKNKTIGYQRFAKERSVQIDRIEEIGKQ